MGAERRAGCAEKRTWGAGSAGPRNRFGRAVESGSETRQAATKQQARAARGVCVCECEHVNGVSECECVYQEDTGDSLRLRRNTRDREDGAQRPESHNEG